MTMQTFVLQSHAQSQRRTLVTILKIVPALSGLPALAAVFCYNDADYNIVMYVATEEILTDQAGQFAS